MTKLLEIVTGETIKLIRFKKFEFATIYKNSILRIKLNSEVLEFTAQHEVLKEMLKKIKYFIGNDRNILTLEFKNE